MAGECTQSTHLFAIYQISSSNTTPPVHRYDNGRLCMIIDHHVNETLPGSPFPSGEVGAATRAKTVLPVARPHSHTDAHVLTVVHLHARRLLCRGRHVVYAALHGSVARVLPARAHEHRLRVRGPLQVGTLGGDSLVRARTTWAVGASHSHKTATCLLCRPLDLSIFTPGNQTNEFNQTRGDAGNPVCVALGGTCGSKSEGGQTVPCCMGAAGTLSCACYGIPCKQYGSFSCVAP